MENMMHIQRPMRPAGMMRRAMERALRGSPGRGFSLIELLVVIAIIIIILAVALPSVSALTRGSSVKQARNMVSAYIATARATAMSTKRQAAVIFYEESGTYTNTFSKSQTAVMIASEDADQTKYTLSGSAVTVFVPWRSREYLPAGVRVATVTAGQGSEITTGQDPASTAKTRAIVFNADGQMVLRTGLACAFQTGKAKGDTAFIVGDWGIVGLNGIYPGTPPVAGTSSSSPGVLLYEGAAYDGAKPSDGADWLKKNADVVVVNAYTGTLLP